ncbi:MAG: hypothetical protein MI864_08110 [Pseudomonadales bacterium]|nr:hypothetical protein [Pseudomonadales bacterium]
MFAEHGEAEIDGDSIISVVPLFGWDPFALTFLGVRQVDKSENSKGVEDKKEPHGCLILVILAIPLFLLFIYLFGVDIGRFLFNAIFEGAHI